MANTLLTSSVIAKESLMQFKNALGFTRTANRQYDSEFGKARKIGDSISVRKPQRFTVSDGAAVSKQAVVNENVQLTLDQRKHVAFEFSTAELSLDIERFSENYLTPAAVALANKVDQTGLLKAQEVANAVGTPGTALSSIDTAIDAGVVLDNYGTPVGNRHVILNPKSQGGIIKGSKSLFQAGDEIAKQYKKGVMGHAAGFEFQMGQNVAQHTIGAYGGTPLVNGGSQTGTTLVTDGWTSGASTLEKGDVFTIAGVYGVNPLTFESTGELQQFVVTADITSTLTAKSIQIYPAITTSGNKQTVTASPADNAAITVLGAASTVTPMNLAYHKDAFVLGCADLIMPRNVDMSSYARDPESGLSIRFVRYYDGDADQLVSRLDILFGWLTAHPEWACRIQA